ncbi:MAG: S4 domain-containing protein, partial [Staphylococcus epidermidis]|nr:S4 domain-containing protein [Staphylococcus epidermidis]
MENYNFNIIEQSQVGQRIDKLVSDLNKDWSRSQLQDWIKEGLVKVNGKVIKS